MAITPDEVRQLDAEYRSFPAFEQWHDVALPVEVWNRYVTRIEALRERLSDPERRAMVERSLRAAALNTGAIEGLHKADRGLTVTVVEQVATWQSAVERAEGKQAVALVEAALDGFDLALDVATAGMPVTEAWIRRVHEVVCAPQETYSLQTAVGSQQHKLPLGAYKLAPNHVELADGSRHAYAPVDRTADEMHRLIDVLAAEKFQAAHPVLQAAFAHHALTTVHPFADGNGRVARVLASVYLLRAASIPLFVFEDQSLEYFDALSAADQGEVGPFARFVFDRALDAIGLAESWSRSTLPDELADALRRSEDQRQFLRDAAERLQAILPQAVEDAIASTSLPPSVPVATRLTNLSSGMQAANDRWFLEGPAVLVSLGDADNGPYVQDWVGVTYDLTPNAMFPLGVAHNHGASAVDVRLTDVEPVVTSSLRARLDAWSRALLADLARELAEQLRT